MAGKIHAARSEPRRTQVTYRLKKEISPSGFGSTLIVPCETDDSPHPCKPVGPFNLIFASLFPTLRPGRTNRGPLGQRRSREPFDSRGGSLRICGLSENGQ